MVARMQLTPEEISAGVLARDRTLLAQKAPALGLTLVKVEYSKSPGLTLSP